MARIVLFLSSKSSPRIIDAGKYPFVSLQGRKYQRELLNHGDAFFVPTIIDQDSALSYDGVDLAISIYLDCIQSGIFDIAVFLLSAEDKGSFYSHCDRADLLKCPNVHFLKNTKVAIEESIRTLTTSPIENETALNALKNLRIKAPSAYKTHHSITNEWSIYRWSKYLGLDSVGVSSEIENSLYFKHLAVVNRLSSIGSTNLLPSIPADPKTPKRILLVDDEAEKGWNDFFKRFLSQSSVSFESLGESSFKRKTSKEIEDLVITKVRSFNPDLVILDLRLEDADFNMDNRSVEYTGIRILKRIKLEINQGIQVIGFTASNKVWNYLDWSDSGHGIDDIIVKESPDLSTSHNSYTADTINHLTKSLQPRLERGQFLKSIDSRLKQIGRLIKKTDSSYFTHEKESLDIAFELIKQYDRDMKYVTYAYIQLFKILEKYIQGLTRWDGVYFKLKHSGKEYLLLKYLSDTTNGKYHCESALKKGKRGLVIGKGTHDVGNFVESNYIMCAVLIYLYGKDGTPDNWIKVRDVRNQKAVHPEKYGDVTKDEFMRLLGFLQFFFDPNNLKLRNESEALVKPRSGSALADDPAVASLLSSLKK